MRLRQCSRGRSDEEAVSELLHDEFTALGARSFVVGDRFESLGRRETGPRDCDVNGDEFARVGHWFGADERRYYPCASGPRACSLERIAF
jgi:hypothetical protein